LGILDLLPRSAQRTVKRLEFGGQSLVGLSARRMSDIRGNRIALVLQDPMTSLNPCYTIGDQLTETLFRHRRISRRHARDRAVAMLEKVGIPNAASRLVQYPHQLSGGLRQRVIIAMALICEPDLLLADEPTTALDVTIQAQILRLLRDLQRELKMALILITHDLGLVARIADRVVVMYAGHVVEQGSVRDIFNNPAHPYTEGLLECIPVPNETTRGMKLKAIRGIVPTVGEDFQGCRFAGRCDWEFDDCRRVMPTLKETADQNHLYRCLIKPQARRRPRGRPAEAVGVEGGMQR
jgi:peptide/nickel transport system ATP-binding protein